MAESKLSEAAAAIQQQLNRDLNCLTDENRGTRRTALNKFRRTFFSDRVEPPPPDVARELYSRVYMRPLLERLSDPVEKCREMGITLTQQFCELLAAAEGSDLTPAMDFAIPIIASRIGVTPFAEVAEELRVQLLDLLRLFINTPSSAKNLRRHIGDVVTIIGRAAMDKFQDTKRATSKCCVALCRSAPDLVHLQLQQLVTPQVNNLTHHRKAVRKAALIALRELILHGSDGLEILMNETVLPALKARVGDRNAPVRKEILGLLAKWLTQLRDARPFEARLVALLLSGASDYAPEIQKLAVSHMEAVGIALLDRHTGSAEAAGDADAATGAGSGEPAADLSSGVADEDWNGADVLPEAFNGVRPARGARVLVRRLLHKILPSVLADAALWTADKRVGAAQLLVTLLAYAEDAATEHITQLIAGLCHGTADDEAAVRDATAQAAAVLGRFVVPDAQLSVLLPQARGEVSGLGTADHRSSTLQVLANAVAGMTSEQLAPHLVDLGRTLVYSTLAEGDPPSLRLRLALAVNKVITSAGPALRGNADVCRLLLRAVLHSQAAGSHADIEDMAEDSFAKLALVNEVAGRQQLFQLYAARLVADLQGSSEYDDVASWGKSNFGRMVFDVLLRTAGPALYPAIDRIMEVLTTTCNAEKEADLRLAQLALVKTLLDGSAPGDGEEDEGKGDDTDYGTQLDAAVKERAKLLIEAILLPNLIWRVGRVAATIRKVGVYCFFTLFKRKLIAQDVLRELYSELVPPLQTCITDDDSTTRRWSCMLLTHAFEILQGLCTHEEVSSMYHDLVKRLDDSNNDVRRAICQTLVAFAGVADAAAFKGTPMEYTVDCYLIHMDDPEASVQEAVKQALIAWGKHDPSFVVPRVEAVRGRHRTPKYCDEVKSVLQALL